MSLAGDESSYRAIERPIATYAGLVDDGDFGAVGVLLADATFTGGSGSVSGRDGIEKMLRENLVVLWSGHLLRKIRRVKLKKSNPIT